MSSSITLDGKPVQDPRPLYRQCLEQGLPTDRFWGRANRFLVPRGEEPGRGWVLMLRADLDKLDVNGTFSLILDDGAKKRGDLSVGRKELKNLSIASPPLCVTPGLRGDPAAHYAVELVDRRGRLATIPIDKGYNVRPTDGGDYLEATTDSGSPWTWATMFADIETLLSISPGLFPFTPAGTPENLTFYAAFAWAALNQVAALAGMAVNYDITADTFKYIEPGATDDDLDAALGPYSDNRRRYDVDAKLPTLCRVAENANVRFPVFPPPADGASPYYVVQKPPPGGSTTISGSVVWLDGGMDALGDPASPDNATDLDTRATDVAAKYFQTVLTGTDPLLRQFDGILTAPGIMPGKRVQGVAWGDVGNGMVTEIYRGPLPGPKPLPLPVAAGTSVRIVRIVDTWVDDGFWRYYPIVFQKRKVPPATPWVDEDTDLTIEINDDHSVDEGGAKPISAWAKYWYPYDDVVGIDGQSGGEMVYQEMSYDPTGTGDYNLPVYATTQYSALREIACSGDPPAIGGQLGG